MTEHETLTKAADKLEELAAKAPLGRWDVQDFPGVPGVILSANYRSMLGYHVVEGGRAPRKGAPVMNRDAAMWIATMSPAVAAPLAALLRDVAKSWMPGKREEWMNDAAKAALAFAKLILGEQS